MDRLKSVFLFALAAFAAPAFGQQSRLESATAAEVTVIGDVEKCQRHSIPAGSAWTVRQAVLKSGLLSESANVTVIRFSQDRSQWTQFVSATSADTGEVVVNGDVLVVQTMSPLSETVKKNAALRTDAGVIVVSLEEDGVAIGDVLQQTNSLPLADKQLKVVCRFQGQTPITNAELHHLIAHGDVISIAHPGRTGLDGFGDMVPAVSEWKSGNRDEFQDTSISDSTTSKQDESINSEL